MFQLCNIPLEQLNLREGLNSPEAGAFSFFEGWVRNHNEGRRVIALEYEAEPSLCQKEMGKILKEAETKFDVLEVKVFHRIGKLNIGEMAVWVGVTAPHRDASFAACRYVIDELKHRLPIWKKEYYADGESSWVGCNHQSSNEQNFYSRQMALPEIGPEGQNKLKNAKVLVVGAGGLGCAALTSLACAGIGTIGIVEHDILQESNLHRQFLYSHEEIGRPKTELAAQRLKALNPYITIKTHPEQIKPENVEAILRDYDLILDCTDNFPAKFLLNDAAFLFKKILIQASIYQWEGQIQIFDSSQKGCLRCLWPEIPDNACLGNCRQAGVLGMMPSVFGHAQALEAVKYFLNLSPLFNKETIVFNLLNYEWHKINLQPNPLCHLCGAAAKITKISEENYKPARARDKKYLFPLKS